MKVSIVGASGYVGGELLRLLIQHPKVEVAAATSNRYSGEYIFRLHPNLRGQTNLKFVKFDIKNITKDCDLLFLATPHGVSSTFMSQLIDSGIKIIDLSADFRLKNPDDYVRWYGWKHSCPGLLKKAVYGLPELYREDIKKADLIACPGCMAICAILALAPIIKNFKIETEKIVVDAKVGSSGAGYEPSRAVHHSEHYSIVRPYKPVGHRHTAEIEQELNNLSEAKVSVSMSVHAVNMVRGILITCHIFLKESVKPVDIWRVYRNFYTGEPFIRLIRDKRGIFRYPDPKLVVGTNFCDIGFEIDTHISRIVTLSAVDNLIKGAAGTAVQNMNIIYGFDEDEGLKNIGLHPL